MGVALWRSVTDQPATDELADYLPPAWPGCRYRIEVFGEPRAAWRRSPADAMADAIELDLANWDASRREHYLAVPVAMRVWRPECISE